MIKLRVIIISSLRVLHVTTVKNCDLVKKKKKKYLERQQFAPTRVWEEGEFSAKISSSDTVVIC